MNPHSQIHFITCASFLMLSPNEVTVNYNPLKPIKRESKNVAVDQFFSQKSRLKNGFVDTSPSAASDLNAASHVQFLNGEKPLPSDMSDDDIFKMVISKKCQTVAELSRLKSMRPEFDSSLDVKDDVVNNPNSDSNSD